MVVGWKGEVVVVGWNEEVVVVGWEGEGGRASCCKIGRCSKEG